MIAFCFAVCFYLILRRTSRFGRQCEAVIKEIWKWEEEEEGSVAAPASPPGGHQETGKGGGMWRVSMFCEKEKRLVGILKD